MFKMLILGLAAYAYFGGGEPGVEPGLQNLIPSKETIEFMKSKIPSREEVRAMAKESRAESRSPRKDAEPEHRQDASPVGVAPPVVVAQYQGNPSPVIFSFTPKIQRDTRYTQPTPTTRPSCSELPGMEGCIDDYE